jgi:hypothetical protein
MPIDDQGRGPITEVNKIYEMLYRVWGEDLVTVAEFKTRAEAEKFISDAKELKE